MLPMLMWGVIMLRSVDMQQILLQTSVVEKVQQVQQQHADVEKKQFALQLQKEMDHKQKEVQDTKESEHLMIREEDRRKQDEGKGDLHERREGKSAPQKDPVGEIDQGKILDLMV